MWIKLKEREALVMKKIIGFILVFLFLITLSTRGAETVFAAGDTIATATSISTGTTYSGSITETNLSDFYEFTINSSGRISIDLTAYICRTDYYLYDA